MVKTHFRVHRVCILPRKTIHFPQENTLWQVMQIRLKSSPPQTLAEESSFAGTATGTLKRPEVLTQGSHLISARALTEVRPETRPHMSCYSDQPLAVVLFLLPG